MRLSELLVQFLLQLLLPDKVTNRAQVTGQCKDRLVLPRTKFRVVQEVRVICRAAVAIRCVLTPLVTACQRRVLVRVVRVLMAPKVAP